jgi:sugar/nucleoside kinase (ribokinase family)
MAKILGIGNALVDLLIRIDNDRILDKLGLPKGSMTLVDEEKKNLIAEMTKGMPMEMASGGSAANTIHGLAKLGVETAYIGTIGNDETGKFFREDLEKNNITPLLNTNDTPSGIASTLISKDKERTFGTYLGAAIQLSAEDLKAEQFEGYDIMHVEGYLVQNHALLETALRLAKEAGSKVSLDLASYNVVEANLEFLQEMVSKYVDIVFANEEEAKAYTGQEPEPALHSIAGKTNISIVKVGSKGSFVKSEGKLFVVEPIRAEVQDTTGAGDAYAAGFLFGISSGYNYQESGFLGSLLASNTIEAIGARIKDHQWDGIRRKISSLRKV